MGKPLRLLLVEDSEQDAELLLHHLKKKKYDVTYTRVMDADSMRACLKNEQWDIIIADYTLPSFNAPMALSLKKELDIDIPFIIVSGAIEEATAVASMEAGAHDYLTKGNLIRLVPAIERELREAKERRERRRTTDALRVSEGRIRTVIDASLDAIIAIDVYRKVTLFNRAAQDMFMISEEAALGMDFSKFFGEKYQSDLDFFIASHLNLEMPRGVIGRNLEVAGIKTDGQEFPVEIALSTGHREDETFLLAIVRDISERKLHEQVLHETEQQLRLSQKMEAIGRLAGGVAHDFNNLLGVIMGYSDVMMLDLSAEDPLRADIKEISAAAKRATSLTRQLLAFSRKQVMQPRVFNVNEVVNGSVKMLIRLIGEDIEFTTDLADEEIKVEADPGQFEQVIMNLVINARDAMPSGGKLLVKTAVVISEEMPSTSSGPALCASISVSDTGMGMDEGVLQRIFEPFFTTKEKGKGTGLGLSTVYGIIAQSGGSIQVDSAIGVGSTFEVLLPLANSDVKLVESKTTSSGLTGTETILVVEDDEMLRTLICRILEMRGYRVVVASDGAEALDICKGYSGKIELLLTDVIMPNMNGKELVDQLELLGVELRVLFMSGYLDNTIVQLGLKDSEVEIIQKPFSAESLVRKVKETLMGI